MKCDEFPRIFVLKCKRYILNINNGCGIVLVLSTLCLCVNLLLYLVQDRTELNCQKDGMNVKPCKGAKCLRGETSKTSEKDRIIYRTKDGRNITIKHALLAGKDWNKKVFLTIGLPTIERDGGFDYLQTTLNSLLQNASKVSDETMIKIVILLTDAKQATRARRLQNIKDKYSLYIETGKIQVIAVPPNGYPKLRGLKRTLGDTEKRMYWRGKQAIDFAFLMEYSRQFSPYYLQLEDDVIAIKDYDIHIWEYIKKKQGINWFNLDFSNMGFIGKLFRSSTLRDLVRFFRLTYSEIPVDFLLFLYRGLLGHDQTKTMYPKNIFIHIGRKSSALTR